MSVTVRDARASALDRRWIESVFREYLDDLAPLNTGVFPALGEVGHREPDQLARWFADSSARILTICKSSAPVGFAMVLPGRAPPGRPAAAFHMAEFFIARAYRRLGIGHSAAALILDRFAGRWDVLEYLRNPGAVKFWRRVVSDYTRGDYEERVANGEVRQSFRSGPSRARSG